MVLPLTLDEGHAVDWFAEVLDAVAAQLQPMSNLTP